MGKDAGQRWPRATPDSRLKSVPFQSEEFLKISLLLDVTAHTLNPCIKEDF